MRWTLHIGHGGTNGAVWCPWRAEHHVRGVAAASDLRPRVGELRSAWRRIGRLATSGVLVFNPREDIFAPHVAADLREGGLAVLKSFLEAGDVIAVTTRGGLDDAAGLVALAGVHGPKLQVRIGIFGGASEDESRWEPGLPARGERLKLASALVIAGAQVEIEVGPIIPFINDDEKQWRSLFRAIARTGATRVVPRFLGGTPALLDQIERELSAGAARMVGGWLSRGPDDAWARRRPSSRVRPAGPSYTGDDASRTLPLQARQPRLQRLTAAALGLPIGIGTCACFEKGHAHVCFRPGPARQNGQLSLFDSGLQTG